MEHQIIICDESGNKIGTTFMRRAKQLVMKNRAYWVDGKHTAICLLEPASPANPKEEIKMDASTANNQAYEVYETIDTSEKHDKDKLYRIAYKRVLEKRKITRHIVTYITAMVIVLFLMDAYYYNSFFQGFLIGCMFISGIQLARRIAAYLKPYFAEINFLSFLNHSDHDRIEREYKKLKRMEPESVSRAYKKY